MHCRHSDPGLPGKQRGAALVLALLVFALCAAIIVGMHRDFNRVYQQASNSMLAQQSGVYLRGAEELAVLALQLDYDQDTANELRRDDLEEVWARDEVPYPLDEGGWLSGYLEDLQGRFNLNSLAEPAPQGDGEPRFTPAQQQFIRLLLALEEPALSEQEAIAITAAIGDWLDNDSNTRIDGAEDDQYFSRTPAYRSANGPMASVSELRSVAGVSAELYLALQPWVTVWPRTPAKLNLHTAPAMVLRSLGEDGVLVPLTESDALALVEYRQENGFSDLDDFRKHPVLADRQQNMSAQFGLLGESSDYFLLRASVEVADRNRRLYSVLQREGRLVTALVRVSGSL
jgi:general secretion pathway protein K